MLTRVDPNCPAGHGDGKGVVGVACALPQNKPAWNSWSGVSPLAVRSTGPPSYVSRLVELFVVVDAEWGDIASATPRRDSPGSSKLRVEKPGGNAGEDEQGTEPMEVGHAHAPGNGGNLGVVPLDRESEWSAPEHAEVIRIWVYFQTYSPEKTK